MKNYRKLIGVAAFTGLMAFTACERVLDILPPLDLATEAALTTTAGLEAALIGSYAPDGGLASGALVIGNCQRVGEIWADNVIAANPGFGELQIINRTLNFFNDQGRGIWEGGYRLINRVNNVIDAVDGGKVSDAAFAANKDRIKGEALFIRGWVQFELVRYFAQPWGFSANNSQLGIVLRDKPTVGSAGAVRARATVAETYTRIINDLQQAEQLLPAENRNAWRSNKAAAAALLARVYFQQNDFTNAAAAASRVVSTNKFSLTDTPRGVFDNNTNTETVFGFVSNSQQDASGALFGSYNQKDNEPPYLLDPDSPVVKILFPATGSSGDKRDTLFAKRDGQFYVAKYDRQFMSIPAIRYAEILLIRAEAVAATNTTQALADVNLVRRRAGLSALTGLSGAPLVQAIQRERLIELAAEGNRFHELKRLQQNIRTTRWNAATLIFKIPDVEVSANTLIEQNPD